MYSGSLEYSLVYVYIYDENSKDARQIRLSDLLISCFRNQVPLQRGDSANKERGGRHLPANHKLRGSELTAATAARDPTAESGQQQTRDTLYVPILFVLLRLVSMHTCSDFRTRVYESFSKIRDGVDFEIRNSTSGYSRIPLHSIAVNKYSKSKNDQRKNTHVRFLGTILKVKWKNTWKNFFFSSRLPLQRVAYVSIKIDSKNPDCTYCVAETVSLQPNVYTRYPAKTFRASHTYNFLRLL